MATPPPNKDISSIIGARIVAEAATWKGTPYKLIGAASKKGEGGDCSGTTCLIYSAAQCPYSYQSTVSFITYSSNSALFRLLADDEQKQEGDILHWPGHMAIYSSFASDPDNSTTARTTNKGVNYTQFNDMWSATHTDGPPYGPNRMEYFKPGKPKVFRYQVK